MAPKTRRARATLLAALTVSMLVGAACDRGTLRITEPLAGQLSSAGPVQWSVRQWGAPAVDRGVRFLSRSETLTLVHPDGSTQPVDATFDSTGLAAGSLDLSVPGVYRLIAHVEDRFLGLRLSHRHDVEFEVVDLDRPATCEILNDVECLLPYPSSRFLVEDTTTATGFRLDLPAGGGPELNGPSLVVDALDSHDGFSPGVHPLVHIPGGVDIEASGASRLIPPVCCSGGPPYRGVRTHDDRSRQSDSPTLILDAETGERILHWVENDARAESSPRQALIFRPAQTLLAGRRYIVALRHLVGPDGSAVQPEPAFRALRDRLPSTIPALEQRRPAAERLFATLETHGVGREDLLIAFDFVVRSETQLTRTALSLRDQTFDWLDARDPTAGPGFSVESVEDRVCAPDQTVRRVVRGTFESPLFLEAFPDISNAGRIVLDPVSGLPVRNGTMQARFVITLPCVLLQGDGTEVGTLYSGHGAFNGLEAFADLNEEADTRLSLFNGTGRWQYITGTTAWLGWTDQEPAWLAVQIIGLGDSRLHDFQAWVDRSLQGQVNALLLSRMMKRGLFNVDPAFQLDLDADGILEGAFPGPEADHHYWGISLGGTFGLLQAALSPDTSKFVLAEGQINFAFQMQRWSQFPLFEALLQNIGLGEPLDQLVAIALVHELWVQVDPAGYVRNVLADRLPGSGEPPDVLAQVAWLDHQVNNHGSAMAARSMGLPNLFGSIQRGLVDIPDLPEGETASSALQIWGTGLDIQDPQQAPFIPPLANQIVPEDVCDPHFSRFRTAASWEQIVRFLRPGGVIENVCDGLCDAETPFEIRNGDTEPCDPLSP